MKSLYPFTKKFLRGLIIQVTVFSVEYLLTRVYSGVPMCASLPNAIGFNLTLLSPICISIANNEQTVI